VLSPQVAELGLMVNLLAASVIGGRGKVAGALLGALLLVMVPEALRFADNWYLFRWGAALLSMLILAPDGVAGALDRLLQKFVKPRWTVDRARQPIASIPAAQLRMENLREAFGGVVAVDGVSMELRAGQAIALIGPNGAGKTTLLNLLCGTEAADSGAIVWNDADIVASDAASRARLGIARSFQTSQLPLDQAAIDAVACGARRSTDLEPARGAALALLERLGLAEQAMLPVRQLAPPSRRLVEIARAMIGRPALLALDEPTAGFNEAERSHLLAVLRRWRDDGLALFVVEHDIAFASSLADRLCCMEAGRIVAAGAPTALLADAGLARFFGRFAA
jgi:branched-chain amino acid transport system permease protein